jgi:hypothetical protein
MTPHLPLPQWGRGQGEEVEPVTSLNDDARHRVINGLGEGLPKPGAL